MPHAVGPHRVCIIIACSCLAGCAGDSSFSGPSIIADLERHRIPVADDDGRVPASPDEYRLPATGPITLADLLAVAEVNNPDLASVRSGVGVAAGALWQASMYPNPRGDVLSEDISRDDGFSGSKTTVGITQPIILGDRRGAAIRAADAERAARLAAVDARRRSLFGEITTVHAQLLVLREQHRLCTELRGVADRTLASAQARFEAKAAPETDVIRPRVEVYRIDAALGRLASEQRASAKQLALLIGGVDVDPARLDGAVDFNPPALDALQLESVVKASHPALVVADKQIQAAEARLERERAERTPDLDVRVAAGYRGETDDGVLELGAGMTIPLWDAREGSILSARFELMQARQDRLAVENDLQSNLYAAAGEYESAKAQLDSFRDQIVPDAQRAFDQTTEGYRAGRLSFMDLLDAQRTLTEARVTLSELAGAVVAARSRILQVVGPEVMNSNAAATVPAATEVPFTTPERPTGAEVSR
ncbi:MAG: TolC family protein [Phycisphaerales bacterium]|nr:TolC family protein [Phycisphaerales bacterium]